MGTLPKFALDHMSTVGVYHRSSHFSVENAILIGGQENYLVNLANAIGGNAALKAIYLGDATSRGFPLAFPPAVNGTSLQRITDISAAIQAIGGAGPDPAARTWKYLKRPLRPWGRCRAASWQIHRNRYISYKEGLDTGLETLKKPVKPFSVAELRTAYGIPATSNVIGNSFPLKFPTAELVIRSGANVINILDSRDTDVVPWDFHQTTGGRSRNGEFSRRRMTQRVIGPMRTFLDRVLNLEGYNVVVAVLQEFLVDPSEAITFRACLSASSANASNKGPLGKWPPTRFSIAVPPLPSRSSGRISPQPPRFQTIRSAQTNTARCCSRPGQRPKFRSLSLIRPKGIFVRGTR